MIDQEAPQLIATCWTSAGDAAPLRGDESSPLDLEYRIAQVAEAGWNGFGLVYGDLVKQTEALGLSRIAASLDAAGLQHRELEFLAEWWTSGDVRRRSDRQRADLFEAAQTIGASTVKASPAVHVPFPEKSLLVRELAAVAADASDCGVRVALEPLPWSNVPDVAAAVSILAEIDNSALGICVDIWHVVRAGTDFSDLSSILPTDAIFVVELDDGRTEVEGTLFEDTINNRLQCGAGDFDVASFIVAMWNTGYQGPWGVEIISRLHRALPVADALSLTYANTLEIFATAHAMATAAATPTTPKKREDQR